MSYFQILLLETIVVHFIVFQELVSGEIHFFVYAWYAYLS